MGNKFPVHRVLIFPENTSRTKRLLRELGEPSPWAGPWSWIGDDLKQEKEEKLAPGYLGTAGRWWWPFGPSIVDTCPCIALSSEGIFYFVSQNHHSPSPLCFHLFTSSVFQKCSSLPGKNTPHCEYKGNPCWESPLKRGPWPGDFISPTPVSSTLCDKLKTYRSSHVAKPICILLDQGDSLHTRKFLHHSTTLLPALCAVSSIIQMCFVTSCVYFWVSQKLISLLNQDQIRVFQNEMGKSIDYNHHLMTYYANIREEVSNHQVIFHLQTSSKSGRWIFKGFHSMRTLFYHSMQYNFLPLIRHFRTISPKLPSDLIFHLHLGILDP